MCVGFSEIQGRRHVEKVGTARKKLKVYMRSERKCCIHDLRTIAVVVSVCPHQWKAASDGIHGRSMPLFAAEVGALVDLMLCRLFEICSPLVRTQSVRPARLTEMCRYERVFVHRYTYINIFVSPQCLKRV